MNSPTTPSGPSPPRRWLQFRLRTALWLLLVVALGLGWWSDRRRLEEKYHRAELLREALRISDPRFMIEHGSDVSLFKTGGVIVYDLPPESKQDATVPPLELHGLNPGTQELLQALAGASASGPTPASQPTYEQRVAEVVAVLSEQDPQRRARAARTLALPAWRDAAALPALIRALDDPQRVVRWHAVYALGEFGSDAAAAAPRLLEMIHSEDGEMSAFAAQMLLKIVPQADVGPRLVELLTDEHADTRRRAALALAQCDHPVGPMASERLLVLLADEDLQVRRAACAAVGRLVPREAALDALLAAFQKEQDATTRSRIARELARLDEAQ